MSEKTLETIDGITPMEKTALLTLADALIASSKLTNSEEAFAGFALPRLGKLLTVSVEKLEGRYYTHFALRDAAELDAEDDSVETSGVQ